MLGVGDAALEDARSEPVRRHLEYARRARCHIDVVVDSRRRREVEHSEALRVLFTGGPRWAYPWAAFRDGIRAGREYPPSLVTSQDPFLTAWVGLFLRQRLGCPLLVQNHSSFYTSPEWVRERPLLFRAFRQIGRMALRRADGYRLVNSIEARYYIERLGLPPGRIRVLPVPCDLGRFVDPQDPRELSSRRTALGIEAGAPVCLWVGRPVRVKRLPVLLRAFRLIRMEVPQARLILVSNRTLAQEDLHYLQAKEQLGAEVIWVEAASFDDLPLYYQMSDVFLFSSAYEGFGRVLVEAGAAGLPVVSTRTAGAQEIVQDGRTGYLVDLEDAASLAERASQLLLHPDLRLQMGRAARDSVQERFDPDQAFEAIVGQWREMAAPAAATSSA
jgi:glycosyltransferase involved in cell wall biosynthesis